jgi:hypothetical protein
MPTRTVYVTIGNSDDKLSQSQWSSFIAAVDRAFEMAARYEGSTVHGRWYSLATVPWQNACWCIEFGEGIDEIVEQYRAELRRLAGYFSQDSIAWAEVSKTEFLASVTA